VDVKENAHLIEGIVGIFDMLSEEDSIRSGGLGSEREMARAAPTTGRSPRYTPT
jgi:hypothetical protein